jgi:ABC-type multidrug transport system fused ATPase/permease subunit
MLAIVGESGAGKTSLLDALCGLFPIASGEILVGSQRLNSHELLAWGKASSVVLQNTPVLAGTVLQNIAWQDGAPDLARAMDAAREAHAVHFIEKLPEQWHTVLGKGGRVLSGGETQRLGLARALYRNSEVLLLDEPTSSLDAEAEDAIIEALRELKGKRTIILITHRLKLAQIADQLIALSSGRIVEQGSWQDLANRPGGVIFDLARRQKLSS